MSKPMLDFKTKTATGFGRAFINAVGNREKTWDLYVKIFGLIGEGSKLMKFPVLGPLYKTLMMYDPPEKRYTHGTILSLDVDISEEDRESCVLPIDLIKDVIQKARIVASSLGCICRQGANCTSVPKDLSCLFFGTLAETAIKRGVAYEISKETALERVDRAAEFGLVPQAMWVEVEQYLWGVQDMDGFFEICLCSPEHCVAMKNVRYGPRDIKERFTSSGWQATVNDNCKKCGNCVESCPQSAIVMGKERIEINDDFCFGCGVCKTKCKNDAIKIELVKPMKASILDYFKEDGGLELHID